MASFPSVVVLAPKPKLSRAISLSGQPPPTLPLPCIYLSQQLTKTRGDPLLSDVTIEVREGTPIMCQSLLLAVACPFLAPLFYPSSATATNTEIFAREFKGSVTWDGSTRRWRVTMTNTSRQTVTALCDAIYDGVIHVTLSATVLRECTHMAAIFQSTVFDMALTSAFKIGFDKLSAADFMCYLDPSLAHLQAVQEQVGRLAFNFLPQPQFNTLDSKQVLALATNDALEWTELKFFEACVAWATEQATRNGGDGSVATIRGFLAPILPHIRFATMNISELSSGVVPTGVLSSEEVVALFGYISLPLDQRTLLDNDEKKLPFNCTPRAAAWNDIVAPSTLNRFTLVSRGDRFWFRNGGNGGHLSVRHDGGDNDWGFRTRDIIATQDHSNGPATQNDWETLRLYTCTNDTPTRINDISDVTDGMEVIIESDENGWFSQIDLAAAHRIVARPPAARKVGENDTWLLHRVPAVGSGDAWQIVHKPSRRVITAHPNHTVTLESSR